MHGKHVFENLNCPGSLQLGDLVKAFFGLHNWTIL